MITLPDLWNPGICGRMGNQLLELAAAKALSIRTGHELVIPECDIGRKIAGPVRIVSREALPRPTHVWREPDYTYNQIPAPPAQDSVLALHGYFQSYKYFVGCVDKIREFFWPGDWVREEAREKFFWAVNPLRGPVTALCVRRTDYLEKQAFHPVQTIEYYERALSEIPGNRIIAVFSDDIPWCRDNLQKLKSPNDDMVFIDEHDPWVKLWMLTECDNFIIANSTYHWWGAMFSTSPDKKVIAPNLWFGPASGLQNKTQDLIPQTWKRI